MYLEASSYYYYYYYYKHSQLVTSLMYYNTFHHTYCAINVFMVIYGIMCMSYTPCNVQIMFKRESYENWHLYVKRHLSRQTRAISGHTSYIFNTSSDWGFPWYIYFAKVANFLLQFFDISFGTNQLFFTLKWRVLGYP